MPCREANGCRARRPDRRGILAIRPPGRGKNSLAAEVRRDGRPSEPNRGDGRLSAGRGREGTDIRGFFKASGRINTGSSSLRSHKEAMGTRRKEARIASYNLARGARGGGRIRFARLGTMACELCKPEPIGAGGAGRRWASLLRPFIWRDGRAVARIDRRCVGEGIRLRTYQRRTRSQALRGLGRGRRPVFLLMSRGNVDDGKGAHLCIEAMPASVDLVVHKGDESRMVQSMRHLGRHPTV